jgi:hypothetical protein
LWVEQNEGASKLLNCASCFSSAAGLCLSIAAAGQECFCVGCFEDNGAAGYVSQYPGHCALFSCGGCVFWSNLLDNLYEF